MSRMASASEFKSFWMRSNCSESFRLRSTRLFCSSRRPEIWRVMYPEYATTAANVMISPKNNFGAGDRWGAGKRCTPREYNVDRLIDQPRNRRPQIVRLESEWPRLRFISNASVGINQVKAIGPAGIGLLSGVAELIDHGGNLDAEFPHTRSGNHGALFFVFWTGEDDFVFHVAFHLPDVARMRLRDVDDQECDLISVLLVELVKGGNLPPERRSSVAAEDQHDRVALRCQTGELNRGALVEPRQREVGGGIADVQSTSASLHPQSLKREQQERDRTRQFGHEATKGLRGLAHDVVERATTQEPYDSDDREGSDQYPF